MAEKKVHLRIITPGGTKVDEKVNMVIMRCTNGDMGIMPNHEARSAVLDYGILRILDENGERRIAVFGGFAEMRSNMLTVLTENAEWPSDIDRAKAEADHQHARRRLQERTDDMDIQNDQILLRRSLVRIEVSSYPLIGNSDVGN